jgi:hypothetical protein
VVDQLEQRATEITVAEKRLADERATFATHEQKMPAELFMGKPRSRRAGQQQGLSYRRFPTAAEAIRFAVEDLPAVLTLGPRLQVGDEQFDSLEIQRLYERDDYPLRRREG